MLLKYTTAADRLLWCLGTVFSILGALIPAASTIIIGKLFNEVTKFTSGGETQEAFMSATLKLCTGLFIIAAIDLVGSSINGVIWRLVGFRVGHRTRLSLFKAYCDGDLTWMDSHNEAVGVASQAFEDVKKVETATGIAVSIGIQTVATLLSCYGVAFYYSWAVTLVCMAGFPLICMAIIFLKPGMERAAADRKKIEDTVNSRLHFVFQALSTVKVFRKQPYEQRIFGDLLGQVYKHENKMWNLSSIQLAVIRFLTLSMFVQGFFFGSFMVRKHGLQAGAVMSTFWACIEGSQALQTMSTAFLLLAEGKASADRLDKILDQDKTAALKKKIGLVRPHSSAPMDIRFENVVFSYPSRPDLVLRGLNMHLKAGEIHYIIGPSGCGKSSIASILLNQYSVDAGKVTIGENVLETTAPHWIHENVTLVEQNAKLFDLSILDNLKMARKQSELVTNVLCEAALHEFQADFVYNLPHGILTPGSFPLSGGQQQRIQLAKAWISNTQVMIFDESTSALDGALERELMENIRTFRENQTTIIITHNLENIPEGHPLHLIEDGEAFWFESVASMKSKRARTSKCLEMLQERKSMIFQQHKSEKDPSRCSSTFYEDLKVEVRSSVDSIEGSESREPASRKDIAVFSTVWEYYKTIPSKKLMILGFLGVVAQAVLTPVFSLVFSHLLMGILPGKDQQTTKWALLLLLVAALDALTSYFAIVLMIVASRWCLNTRKFIIGKLVRYDSLSHDDVTYYKKLLLGDMEATRNIIVRYWRGWVNLISLGLTGIIWAMVSGWKLALLGVAMVPIVIGLTYCYKRINQYWTERFEGQALQVKRMLEDIVTGYRTVKTQNLEQFFEKHYIQREEDLWRTAIRLSVFTSIFAGFLEIFTPLAQGLLLWFGFKLISTGEYTAQKTMLVFSMLIFCLVSIDSVAHAIQQCGNAFEALPRIMTAYHDNSRLEHESVQQDFTDLSTIDWGKISFSQATVSNTLIQNFTKRIQPGKCTVIAGPSGGGKTTISRLLLKLQTVTSGTISIDGHDISTLSSEAVRRKVALAAQMPIDLFEGTILENLSYGLDPSRATDYESLAIEYCKECGLHDFIENLEDGYETIIRANLLSGGQMQRLGIVRALMSDPSVLILDEPTSALDEKSCEMIKRIVKTCTQRGITVLLITHQYSMMSIGDDKIDIFK